MIFKRKPEKPFEIFRLSRKWLEILAIDKLGSSPRVLNFGFERHQELYINQSPRSNFRVGSNRLKSRRRGLMVEMPKRSSAVTNVVMNGDERHLTARVCWTCLVYHWTWLGTWVPIWVRRSPDQSCCPLSQYLNRYYNFFDGTNYLISTVKLHRQVLEEFTFFWATVKN